jgi:hypothetical protein|tara:strand:+ start:201 stop:416 length:216 start_codon:yes stop_codon:yes gene_type:complete
MKVYEVLTSYMSVEVHHVKANNEEEALKQFHNGESRHSKTYDDEYDDLVQVSYDEGPWSLAEYTKEYGEFE